ncbi:hypothetical protein [Streptomyces sp. DSM 40907]|uniref:hypothetical protein n=1 Tax=Streptomyces kutzneri TaxID=3051179 RepID=UPI0028D3F249|nr:hypothetical protein [Streptomyces sp. DSM 40907]
MDRKEPEKPARIAMIITAVGVAAFASVIYIRHLAKIGCRDRYILPAFLNHGIVPFWIEISYGFVLGVSLVVLSNVLPLWASLAVFLAAVAPSTELARRRHNRRHEKGWGRNAVTDALASGSPGEQVLRDGSGEGPMTVTAFDKAAGVGRPAHLPALAPGDDSSRDEQGFAALLAGAGLREAACGRRLAGGGLRDPGVGPPDDS